MTALARRYVTIVTTPSAAAVCFVFFANGFLFANWVVRIPSAKAALDLSDGQLGLAIVAMGVGGIIAMPLGGALIAKRSSREMSLLSGLIYCLVYPLVGLAPSLAGLAAALFVIGLANGAMDVSMNAQASAVEAKGGPRMMSFAHAMFSLGMAGGAIPAGVFASFGVPLALHIALVAAPLAVGILLVRGLMVADPPQTEPDAPAFAIPRGPLLFFGLICLCGAIAEGAMNDWIAVYIRDTLGGSPAAAALAFGTFATAMVVARLLGDPAAERFGTVATVRWGLILAAAGVLLALTAVPALYLVGFAAVGIGVAGIFPSVFRAAGRLPGRSPGPSMAAAVTLGYGGFLLGPALIGFVADVVGLQMALGLLVPLCLFGAALAHTLGVADREP
ncbi:MAG: MFS transporter [Pseudomonadota bacterium]